MLWWLRDDSRLSFKARTILSGGDNSLLWSMASSWEIAIKLKAGKLGLSDPVERLFADIVTGQGVEVLPIGHDHCARLAALPLHHRDPFDRMLVVQAQQERVPILTADSKLGAYDPELIW